MDATRAIPTILIVAPTSLSALSACGGDSTGVSSEGPVAIPTFDCMEEGVNTDPFTVADALAANTPDHEDASDYTWNVAEVVPITLNGDAISVGGDGATVSGSTVTISSAGTYAISGTLNVPIGDGGNPSPLGEAKFRVTWSRARLSARSAHQERPQSARGLDSQVSQGGAHG